jgi:predicted aspartyl protease
MSRFRTARVCTLLVAAVTLLAATPAPGPGSPGAAGGGDMTLETLLAKAQAARGNAAPARNEIEVWKIHELGLDGTLRRVSRGRDWTETRTRDGIATADGSSGGVTWRQNENGEVIVEQSSDAVDLDKKSAGQGFARVRAPLEAWLVQTVATNGSTRRDYYDVMTFRLVRRERDELGTREYEVFEDYTTNSAGRTFARHVYGGDGRPGNDWDQQLISDDLASAVSPAEVAIPANRRTLVEFPKGISSVRLPAQIVRGLIVVRAQIGGKSLDFILDSGSDSIALDATEAERLGLAFIGRGTATVAGSVAERLAVIPEMDVGELRMRDVVVDTLPISVDLEDNVKAVGLLGFDFLDGAAVTVDYDNGTVDATAPEAFEPPASATRIATGMNYGVPEVSLALGGLQGDRFVVDTGAQQVTVVLFRHFARLHPRAISEALWRGYGQKTKLEMVGGTVTNTQVLLKNVSFGPWYVSGMDGLLSNSPPAFDNQDGLIGSKFLGLFKLTLDEPHARIYLEPTGPMPLGPAAPKPP